MLLFSLPAFSQGGATGRILGTVTDQSGGVIAGATVSVIDVDRGITRTLTTTDAGEYSAPNLQPGKYTVRAEAKGFQTIERQNVILEVGKEPRVDITMAPGAQVQTITITEQLPLVETTNATLGGTLNNTDIIDLPLNGRDYQNLLALRPGVQLYPGGGPWTQSANGARPDESVWMVDGVINFNGFDARPVENMPGPFQDAATTLPIDAIQEFNAMENPKAEYGWKTGAVVNVGIKSGTNTLHGSLYDFYRSSNWDARNFYNVAPNLVPGGGGAQTCGVGPLALGSCNQVPVDLRQFGATVGGPIKKDKLFFFAGYEGYRDVIGDDYSLTTPATSSFCTTASPTGAGCTPKSSMVDAINALHAQGITPSTVSLNTACPNAVGMALPLPTSFVCNGGGKGGASGGLWPTTATGAFLSTFPINSHSDNGIGKIDWHPNEKNAVFGSLFVSDYNALGEDHGFTNQLFTDFTPIRVWSNVDSWVYTPNSNVVNEFRIGYDRTSFNFINFDANSFTGPGAAYPFINTGSTLGGFPTVTVAGFAGLGTNANRPQENPRNPYWDGQDSISYLKGKHAFKFGAEVTHFEADSAIFNNGRGSFAFNGGNLLGGASTSLEDFFGGAPSFGALLSGNALVVTTTMSYAGYLQDDWRMTPKLMINLGLRYTYTTPLHANNNLFGNFNPAVGMVQEGSNLQPGGSWNGYTKGLDPRFGFAYDVTGKGTTVVRGGVAIVHTVTTPLLTWFGEFGLQNDSSTSLAAVPTGAAIQCVAPNVCPSNGGGTINLQSAVFGPGQLCWNSVVAACGAQTTILPAARATCGDGLAGDANPCDIMGVDPNLPDPFTFNYNISIQHQIGNNLSIEVGYVGSKGYNLLQFSDINQTPPGAAYCLNALTAAQKADACKPGNPDFGNQFLATQEARPLYTKFPYLGFINFGNPGSYSNYNSLQVSINKRMSHGLSFVAGYTYAHGFDTGSINRFQELPQDSTNLAAEYAPSDFDIRHRLTLTGTYNIPGIKGFAQLLEGWQINAVYSYSTPQPWASWDGTFNGAGGEGDNISGTGERADRWNITGNPLDFPTGKDSIPACSSGGAAWTAANVSCVITNVYGLGQAPANAASDVMGCLNAATAHGGVAAVSSMQSFGCFPSLNGNSFLTPPPLGQFGNMGRNIFRDFGFNNLDMSLFKNFRFKERYGLQFRCEVFNVMNHPIPANPYGSSSFVNGGNTLQGGGPLGFPGVTNDFAAGNPLVGSGSQRVLQLGAKLTF